MCGEGAKGDGGHCLVAIVDTLKVVDHDGVAVFFLDTVVVTVCLVLFLCCRGMVSFSLGLPKTPKAQTFGWFFIQKCGCCVISLGCSGCSRLDRVRDRPVLRKGEREGGGLTPRSCR